jgi:hypothetical protein
VELADDTIPGRCRNDPYRADTIICHGGFGVFIKETIIICKINKNLNKISDNNNNIPKKQK